MGGKWYHTKIRRPLKILLRIRSSEVGALPVEGREELKRTNEIKMAIPLLDTIDITGKVVTADALLTQR